MYLLLPFFSVFVRYGLPVRQLFVSRWLLTTISAHHPSTYIGASAPAWSLHPAVDKMVSATVIMSSKSQAVDMAPSGFSMAHLPLQQRTRAWDITEDNFWSEHEKDAKARFVQAETNWQREQEDVVTHARGLHVKLLYLRQEEDRLNRELVNVRSEAARLDKTLNEETRQIENMKEEYATERQRLLERDRTREETMRAWFKQRRKDDGIGEREQTANDLIDKRPLERQSLPLRLPPLANLDLPHRRASTDKKIVPLLNAQGTILDKLSPLRVDNKRAMAIESFSVLRPVKFNQSPWFFERINPKIYDTHDGTCSSWIACMIQATGTIQTQKCHCCKENELPFDGCVVVSDALFPKCGNCEWNQRDCLGLDRQTSRESSHASLVLPPYNTPSVSSSPPSAARLSLESTAQSVISGMEAVEAAAREASARAHDFADKTLPPATSAFTPVNGSSIASPTSPRSEISGKYRDVRSASSRPPASGQDTPSTAAWRDESPVDLREITRNNLALRHDGVVYTHPRCVEGVPLQKISPGHPYWDPKWPDLRSMVEPILNAWREKHQAVTEAARRGQTVGSVKYQYGRQVNRGEKILRFLDLGVISPYQLLSKRFTSVGKGSITSYDTLFRLCDTITELEKYKLEVEPVDWLRHRLHELIEQQGASFNFGKTIHDFYNDPKLADLRAKSGYKNIGRPSGMKMGQGRQSSRDQTPRPAKRKSPHVYATPSPAPESIWEVSTVESYDDGPSKKQKPADAVDSLTVGDVSDADSYSGAPISRVEFRVYQVRTRLFTSAETVTQYWMWVPELSMFEHQILKAVDPVAWGVHREPIDFGLHLEDVVKAVWNLRSLRVLLVMSDRQIAFLDDRPRGDVMVSFKRENTMRRFLKFCREKEVDMFEETW